MSKLMATTVMTLVALQASSAWAASADKDPMSQLEADIQAGTCRNARERLSPFVAKNNAKALCLMGDLYDRGDGVPHDPVQALALYQKAAQEPSVLSTGGLFPDVLPATKKSELAKLSRREDPQALYTVAVSKLSPWPLSPHADQSVKLLQKAAERSYPPADNLLGVLYQHGVGVEKDYRLAFDCFKKASEAGYAPALSNLGFLYYTARGVERNYREAARCFDEASRAGNIHAESNLGWLYQQGKGVEKNYQEAVRHYARAAAHGLAAARYNLGYMYQYGLGVEQDYEKSARLYSLAAADGGERANLLGYSWAGNDLSFNTTTPKAVAGAHHRRGKTHVKAGAPDRGA